MSSLFLFQPNYAESIKDSFEWRTEVQRSSDGGEHRRQLREFPRRTLEFTPLLTGQDKQIFENWLAVHQARAFYLPLWHEQSRLTAQANSGDGELLLDTTVSSFEESGYALLFRDKFTYKIVQLSARSETSLALSITLVGTWSASTRVYPLVLARLEESQRVNRLTSTALHAPLKFLFEGPVSAFAASSFAANYRGMPILTTRNNWQREVTSEYNRQLEIIDFEVFGQFVDDESGLPTVFLDYHFLLKTAAERYGFIQQLYYLAGKWQALWVSSGQHDFTLVAAISSGSNSITVRYTGLSVYGIVATKPAISITLKNGTVFYRHLVSAVNHQNNTETLTLDSVIDSAIAISDVLIISYLMPMRLAADLQVIEHLAQSVSQCSVGFQTVYLIPEPVYPELIQPVFESSPTTIVQHGSKLYVGLQRDAGGGSANFGFYVINKITGARVDSYANTRANSGATSALVYLKGSVYWANCPENDDGGIHRNRLDGSEDTVVLGHGQINAPVGLATDGRYLWTLLIKFYGWDADNQSIIKLDRNLNVINTITIDSIDQLSSRWPEGSNVYVDEELVWATCVGIAVYSIRKDMSSFNKYTIYATHLAFSPNNVWASGNGEVKKVNKSTGAIEATYAVSGCRHILYVPALNQLVITSAGSNITYLNLDGSIDKVVAVLGDPRQSIWSDGVLLTTSSNTNKVTNLWVPANV